MKETTSLAVAPPLEIASSEIPTISRPLSLYSSLSSTKSGIPFLQGGHHVAQKSMITIFPLRLDSFSNSA